MAKNHISDLRDHLFETIEALKDRDAPMELDRAKVICQVAQTLINSAKVEVEYLEAAGELLGQTTDIADRPFFNEKPALPPAKPNGGMKQ